MDRFIRFSGTGAHLPWRVKNGAKSVPFKTLDVLKDGSGLPAARERRHALPPPQDRRRPGPPAPAGHDRAARLFTVLTRTRGGRVKTAQIRLLTTLFDRAFTPLARFAALYQKNG